jgi:hypothetical protein
MPRSSPHLGLLTTIAFAAIALCACDGRKDGVRISSGDRQATSALRAVTQLECPDHQGPLTRVRIAADGLSCDYAGPKGAEVTLRLVKLDDDQGAQNVLSGLERELNALIPTVAAKIARSEAEAEATEAATAEADAASDQAEARAEAMSAAAEQAEVQAEIAQAAAEKARALARHDAAEARSAQARADAAAKRLAALQRARAHAHRDHDNVNVALPGLRVNAHGDKADVRLPGISVRADGDNADVRVGPITIKADDRSGNVNIDAEDTEMTVRSQDEAAEIRTRHKGNGTRATYILADDDAAPTGWRMVGYEARGPEGGPLVVAVVRSKERHSDDDVFNAAKALVKRNAGG